MVDHDSTPTREKSLKQAILHDKFEAFSVVFAWQGMRFFHACFTSEQRNWKQYFLFRPKRQIYSRWIQQKMQADSPSQPNILLAVNVDGFKKLNSVIVRCTVATSFSQLNDVEGKWNEINYIARLWKTTWQRHRFHRRVLSSHDIAQNDSLIIIPCMIVSFWSAVFFIPPEPSRLSRQTDTWRFFCSHRKLIKLND